MKRSYKNLILLGAATFAITSASILNTTSLIEKYEEKIQAYIKNPSSALDNIFIENNQIILPFIYDNATQTMTADKIKEEFKKANLTVKSISTGTEVGTGTKITVNENSKVYNILVYGDVNGDGEVDLADAQKVILYKRNPGSVKLEGLYFKAANVGNDDNEVDLADAQRIIMFKRGTLPKRLVVVEPQTTKDNVKPVIILKGNKTETIEVGTVASYTDPGMTASDNFDGNISASDIKVEGRDKVNTKVVGKYLITYTTVDCHGNKGTATRTINVVDTTKPVIKLNGANTITINVGEEYRELGATATDNYKITSKVQITGEVNNKVAGEYTLYYNVKDDNNNAAVQVTRKVIVKDQIASISANIPTINYNYGETKLDLTGLQIAVNWKSSPVSNIDISEDMIVKDYDLTQIGEQTITVKYEGFTTTFKINVCKPINAIELIEDGRQNVTKIEGGYKANSNKEFILGTIRAVQIEDGSTLQEKQINIEKQKIESDGTIVEAGDLSIATQVDEQGNITLKGKAVSTGNYMINVYITYGTERIEKSLELQVEKDSQVKTIELEAIQDEEVRLNNLQVVQKELTIKNVNDEDLEIANNDFKIENLSAGITITRLGTNKKSIEGKETEIIKYLEIATTLKDKQEVGFTIKIGNVSKEIKFVVGDALVLSSIEIDVDNVPVYAEQPQNTTDTVKKVGEEYYTIVPINFYNQKGEKINVPASAIYSATQGSETKINTYLQDENNVVIVLPKAKVIWDDGDSDLDRVLNMIKYDEKGNQADGGTYVTHIGIAMINEEGTEVDLNSLNGKNIELRCKKQTTTTNVPVSVNYKKISTLQIDESVSKNVTIQEGNANRIVNTNKEFILGKMQVGMYEGPLTKETLELKVEGMEGKINIAYDIDENNNVIIKGTALEEGTCQITASVKGSTVKANNIFVKAVSIPNIERIEIENEKENVIGLEIGKVISPSIKAISTANPSGETLKVRDIDIQYDENSINIEYLDSGRKLVDKSNSTLEVAYLEISTVTGATEGLKDITITLYKGKENEYVDTTKKIEIYKKVPRAIDIAQTVEIYDEENEETVMNAGKIYTLVPIKVYKDEQKSTEITLSGNAFITKSIGTEHVLVTAKKIPVQIKDDVDTEDVAPIDVKYFKKDKTIAGGAEEVYYIGFAYNVDEGEYTFDKTELNNYEISLTCTNNSNEVKIKMHYTAPTTNE